MNIEQEIVETMRKIFDNPNIAIRREMTANDVLEWDSISHVDLLLSLEQKFKVKFKTVEIGKLLNVGDLIDSIQRKVALNNGVDVLEKA